MLISERYREQNKQLHVKHDGYGRSGAQWVPTVYRMIENEGFTTVLDYGCGKGELARGLAGKGKTSILEYDPAVEGKDATPESADLVVCTDVLEHIEPVNLNAVLRDLKRCTRRKMFFNIATVPAFKVLDDGRNAHLIVKPADWWRKKLAEHFHILLWKDHHGQMVYGEACPKSEMGEVINLAQHRATKKRRQLTPEFAKWFELIRAQSAKYNDRFSRIETIRMWEGGIDEEVADLQCVVGIMEHVDDVDQAMCEVIKVARKAVMLCIVLKDNRSEADWRNVIERRLRISDWHVQDGGLVAIGSPMVSVEGITAVGAVDVDERWAQVKAAAERFQGRVQPAAPHARRAIVACYGPSLAATIDVLRREAAEPDVDVISVSGAHDFLLRHGVVPRYHVECDPRPHKADNLAVAHPDVTYLIASCCAGPLFDKLKPESVKLWHVGSAEHSVRLIDELHESIDTVISGGGSVGLRSIPLLYQLGYRAFSFFAMDCSFTLDTQTQAGVDAAIATRDVEKVKAAVDAIGGARQWAGPHAGKTQLLCSAVVRDRLFITSPQLMTYATQFFETIQKTRDVEYRLYGDGLLQSMAQHYADLVPQIEQAEAV